MSAFSTLWAQFTPLRPPFLAPGGVPGGQKMASNWLNLVPFLKKTLSNGTITSFRIIRKQKPILSYFKANSSELRHFLKKSLSESLKYRYNKFSAISEENSLRRHKSSVNII